MNNVFPFLSKNRPSLLHTWTIDPLYPVMGKFPINGFPAFQFVGYLHIQFLSLFLGNKIYNNLTYSLFGILSNVDGRKTA
jgi:hypothetical protein